LHLKIVNNNRPQALLFAAPTTRLTAATVSVPGALRDLEALPLAVTLDHGFALKIAVTVACAWAQAAQRSNST
jgi:hypothetical protein